MTQKRNSTWQAVLVSLIALAALNGAKAQVFNAPETQDQLNKLNAEIKAYRDKVNRANAAASGAASTYNPTNSPGANPIPAQGEIAPWKMRTTRYTCASGVTITTKQRLASAEAMAAIEDRREFNTLSTAKTPVRLSAIQTELDALDDLDTNLRKRQSVTLTLKYKTYVLKPEKTTLGWHYINRSQGISWGERQRKGILKNMYSGRILAMDCNAGVPLVLDSPDNEEVDVPAAIARP